MKSLILILLVAACSSQLLGGFQPIDLELAENDSEIQNLIDFGIQDITQQGFQSEELSLFSSFSFSLTKINSIQFDGHNYKFNCDFTNEESTTIQAEFEIRVNFFSFEKKVVSSSYKVLSTSMEESVDQSYTEVDQMEIEYSDEIQSVLSFGLDSVVQKIKGKASNFKIVKVVSVERQIVQAAFFYKCNVNIINIQTQKTTNAVYIVYYQPSTDQKSLIDYSVDDKSNTNEIIAPIEENYIPLDTQAVQKDQNAKACLDYGIGEVTKIGVSEKKITTTEFSLSTLNQVETQTLGDGVFYKFNCDLKNTASVTIKTTFTVYYSVSTSTYQLTQYNYDVQGAQPETPIEEPTEMPTEESTEESTEMPNIPGFPPQLPGGNEMTQYESGNHEVQTKEVNLEKSSYTQMSASEIQYSSEVQSCIDYGVQQIVQNSNYKITKTNSVYRKVVQNMVYYKFDVDVQSSEGKTTGLSCIVNYNPQIEQKVVQAYSYYTKKVEQSSYSSSSTSIINPDGSTSYTNITQSSYSSRQFTQISTSSVQTNSKYKSILQSGVDQCVQNLVSSKIVSSSSFSIAKVKKVFSQKRTSQENCVFSVQLVSQEGVSVDVNMNVNYQSKTGQKTLTSYFVEGYSSTQSQSLAQNQTQTQGQAQSLVQNQVAIVKYSNNQMTAANYQKISSSKSLQSKSAIQYGATQVVKQVAKKESLLATDFRVTKIQNVYQELINSSSYTVVATMMNSKGQSIDCSYSVNYKSSKSKVFKSYSYVLY